jgi:hypothetical protein
MRNRLLLGALVFGLGLGLVAGVPAADKADKKADPDRIAKLIAQLGSNTFTEREQATKDLAAIGEPALEALRKATKSDDAETRRRASELVKNLEAGAETAKVLKPTTVHWTFKDTPVKDAVAEIQKKTGFNITLQDPENKIGDRKVTFDSGETTFWEAFDAFCQKAGIHEATLQELQTPIGPRPGGGGPLPPDRVPPGKPLPPVKELPADKAPAQDQPAPAPAKPGVVPPGQTVQIQVQIGGPVPVAPVPPVGGPAGKPGFGGFPGGFGLPPGQLILRDGKADALPTHYAGSLRIRALPPGTPVFNFLPNGQPNGQPKDGEIMLALQVTPEPNMQWQNLVSIKIDKCVDDQDQDLTQVMAKADEPGGDNGPAVGGIAIGGVGVQPALRVALPFRPGAMDTVPVRLKKADKATKAIKEIKGTISCQVRTAPEPLLTVENLMKAAGGEAVKGANGGSLKVTEAAKGDNGEYKIKVEFEPMQDVIGGGGPIFFPGGGPVPIPLPAPAPGGVLPVVPPAAPGAPGALQVQAGGQGQGGGQAQPGGPVRGVPVAPANPTFTNFNGMTLVNEKGDNLSFSLTEQTARQNGNTVVWGYTFTCKPEKDQGGPAKLVYSGSRTVTIDVPFTLKDVPVTK